MILIWTSPYKNIYAFTGRKHWPGKHHTCAGQGCCIYLDGATYIGMVLQSTLALLEQLARALITPLVMVLESTLALAEEVARAWITPLELAACLVAPLT